MVREVDLGALLYEVLAPTNQGTRPSTCLDFLHRLSIIPVKNVLAKEGVMLGL
jgi:hypothetical protein